MLRPVHTGRTSAPRVMNTLRHLRDRIVADPDDLGLRLLYGDLLVERGDPRGKFVHLQLELAARPTPELTSAAAALLVRYGKHWVAPVHRGSVRFIRGFIEEWSTPAPELLRRGARVARAVPLKTVRLSVPGAGELAPLAQCAALHGLRTLEIRGLQDGPFGALGRVPFRRLERLALSGEPRHPGDYALAMLTAPWFPRLRELELDLPFDRFDGTMFGRALPSLESLRVRGVVPTGAAPRLRWLRVSQLADCGPLADLVAAAPVLELLALQGSTLSDESARRLSSSRSLQRLRLDKVQLSRAARQLLRERFGAQTGLPAPDLLDRARAWLTPTSRAPSPTTTSSAAAATSHRTPAG